MVRRRARLSRSSEFQRIYRQGSSTASRYLVLHYFRRAPGTPPESGPRLGLSVSRKVGGAVVRNRIKRQLREAYAALEPRLAADHDYVLIARPPLAGLVERQEKGDKGIVQEAVIELFRRASLLAEESENA